MTTLDIICSVLCGILLLQGIWYGFLKGLFFIFGWISALLGAYFGYDYLGSILVETFSFTPIATKIISLAIGFLLPFLLFGILGRYLHKAISKSFLSVPNRIFGALLGLFKAILICSFILTVVHLLPLSGSLETAKNNSFSYRIYKKELSLFGIENKTPDIKGFVKEKANVAIDSAGTKIKKTATKALEETTEKVKQETKEKIGF